MNLDIDPGINYQLSILNRVFINLTQTLILLGSSPIQHKQITFKNNRVRQIFIFQWLSRKTFYSFLVQLFYVSGCVLIIYHIITGTSKPGHFIAVVGDG